MLKELEGKGTYCSLVAAVVVVKDVVLFAAFAINVELARALVGAWGRQRSLQRHACSVGCCAEWRGGSHYCFAVGLQHVCCKV